MKHVILAFGLIALSTAARAQAVQSGSVGGMPYVLLPASGGCSTATPCSLVTYLGGMDKTAAQTAADVQAYFGGAFAARNPHTIVIAPEIPVPQGASVKSGEYDAVTLPQLTRAIAVVQAVEQQMGGAVNPADSVVTGGGLRGDGVQAARLAYGPNAPPTATPPAAASPPTTTVAPVAATPATSPSMPPVAAAPAAPTTTTPVVAGPPTTTVTPVAAEPATPTTKSSVVASPPTTTVAPVVAEPATLPATTVAPVAAAAATSPSMPPVAAAPTAPAPSTVTASGSPPAATPAATQAAPTAAAVCTSIPAVQTLLPCGPLHTAGSQIVDQQNRPVRMNCAAWWGDLPNYDQQMLTMVTSGINCLRISFYNASIDADLAMIDQTAIAAAKVSLRIIVDNHENENAANGGQQANGLWYDVGGASDGTDGAGNKGTVSQAKWVSDWAKVGQYFAGSQTVIGYDLRNEPTTIGSRWGNGDPNTDIRLAYQQAGNAILAVDSSKLIIAEGVQDYGAGAPWGDLRPAQSAPVTLTVPNRVVYSVHVYDSNVAGPIPDHGPSAVSAWNATWGFMVSANIAPVWIGETGANMQNAVDAAWAATFMPYVNGTAQGGLTVPPGGQGVGTGWWFWGYFRSAGYWLGMLAADLVTPLADQAAVYGQLVQQPLAATAAASGAPPATTAAYARQVATVAASATPPAATGVGVAPSATLATVPVTAGQPAAVGTVSTSPANPRTTVTPTPASVPASVAAANQAAQQILTASDAHIQQADAAAAAAQPAQTPEQTAALAAQATADLQAAQAAMVGVGQ